MSGRNGDLGPFGHRAYERLAGYCASAREYGPRPGPCTPRVGPAGYRPSEPAGPWPPDPGRPGRGRPDVCPRCDARRTCCQCESDVDDLRLFARRMAELHEPTGTPVCGCGTHNCYVRRRLDDIGRRGQP